MAEKDTNVKKPNIFIRIGRWFKSLKAEAKKVAWASAESVRKSTIVVIVCVIILAAAIGLVDFLLSQSIGGLSRIL